MKIRQCVLFVLACVALAGICLPPVLESLQGEEEEEAMSGKTFWKPQEYGFSTEPRTFAYAEDGMEGSMTLLPDLSIEFRTRNLASGDLCEIRAVCTADTIHSTLCWTKDGISEPLRLEMRSEDICLVLVNENFGRCAGDGYIGGKYLRK